MLPKELPKEPLPPFGKLHTVPVMTKVAKGLVVIKKATAEIAKAENYLLGGVTEDEFRRTTLEIAKYAQVIDKEASGLIVLLGQMGTKVAAYKKELANAIG